MKYKINYGFGIATLYTPSENWSERFYKLAGQCFGIRKSIMFAHLISSSEDKPNNMLDEEYERLEHNGDIIVWNKNGEKIKSEWDF